MRTLLLCSLLFGTTCLAEEQKPFAIHVIDDQTGRGVPLVQLETTSHVRFITDSAGYAAIDDPAMLGRKVFFNVSSHGYEFPADGFGAHGKAIQLEPGGQIDLKIKRINVAERLYRVTGEGIYRDSIILNKPAPITHPLLNAEVTGQDSAQTAVYHGKILWLWGDTSRQSYALGQFSMSGATSELPGKGGLDPAVGINLNYFVDKTGFSRPMFPATGGELHWIDGLAVVPDETGREKLVGGMMRLLSLAKPTGQELVVYNDDKNQFETLKPLDLKTNRRLRGHPFHHVVDGIDYVYFGDPWPNQRCKADFKTISDPDNYEAYVPTRDSNGKVTWSWQNTDPLMAADVLDQLRSGRLKPDDSPFAPRDLQTGRPIRAHYGSVIFSPFLKKWTMIFVEQFGGPSFLGEVWYLESSSPQGPWRDARKILTHDHYSFYNPIQHDFFNVGDGRYLYFQGTYAMTFSRDSDPTPRYEYNQMMCRLDLTDERLRKK